jgi:hypothetical protein
MLLVRPNRKSTSGWVSCHIAFICLTALGIVLARSAPLNFTHTPPPNFRHASLSPAGHSHASSERSVSIVRILRECPRSPLR